MKYLCLIYNDEQRIAALSKEEASELMGQYLAFTRDIQQSGHYVTGERLRPTHTATSVRARGGRISATDGPFAETKEQLGGFYLINATDLNEAIQVASRIPAARSGTIEVRPIWEVNAE